VSELTGRLGLGTVARALVVTADDFGLCHASTMGTLEALRAGVVSSCSLLVVAPWAREAAARTAGFDVGVQLALTAGLPRYRWGPVTFAPSLLGGDGGFPTTIEDLHDHADPDEVRRECRAQFERAVLYGISPTHLSVHDGALFAQPALFDVLLELASDVGLPLRLPDRSRAEQYGYPLHQLTHDAEVVHPDHVTGSGIAVTDPDRFVAGLDDGVTELVVRPALDTDELRALAPDADERVGDLDGLLSFGALDAVLDREGVSRLTWASLRTLAGAPSAR
jgi:chitin disaccharide deacetylase